MSGGADELSRGIESSDVIRLVLQFLKEVGLRRSLYCLQEESRVTLNAVDNIEAFESDLLKGRWDAVLSTVGTLKIDEEDLFELYEQIVLELVETGESEVAGVLMRESDPLKALKTSHPQRHQRLATFCNMKGSVDKKELYGSLSRDKRRAKLAKALVANVERVPSSRLVSLLGMALKWQQDQGLLPPGDSFDLFKGVSRGTDKNEDQPLETIARTIKFGAQSAPQVAVYSPNGQYLITGSSDGIIEVWDSLTGALASDLDYQKKECFMVHESAVLSLTLSMNSTLLASGSKTGEVKIWKLAYAQCVKKFTSAHTDGITSLLFTREANTVVSASLDSLIRVFGLKSGRCLKEFRGHSSFVNAIALSDDESRLISGSSDGMVKIWNFGSTDCLLSLTPPPPTASINPLPIFQIFPSPKGSGSPRDSFYVCTRSNTVQLINLSGQLLKKFTHGKTSEDGSFVAATISPHGKWLYAVGEDRNLYTFDGPTGDLEALRKIHENEVIGIVHHPSQSLGAVYTLDGALHLLLP